MGRPKAVNFKDFPLYNKLHTEKTKMMSGVEMTTLYPIKETELFYRSIEVWSHCASTFKHKKKDFELKVEIPEIKDKKTLKFLEENCWATWVERQIADEKSDMKESVDLLSKLFPEKKIVYFFELESILSSYCHGSFISYDDHGMVEIPEEHQIKDRKYYTHKYNRSINAPEIKALEEKWKKEKSDKRDKYLSEYLDAEEAYAYKHNDLTDIFVELGKNSVCYPVAFKDGTANWYKKENKGKEIGYAHAGEIFFVTTPDAVYFEKKETFLKDLFGDMQM